MKPTRLHEAAELVGISVDCAEMFLEALIDYQAACDVVWDRGGYVGEPKPELMDDMRAAVNAALSFVP